MALKKIASLLCSASSSTTYASAYYPLLASSSHTPELRHSGRRLPSFSLCAGCRRRYATAEQGPGQDHGTPRAPRKAAKRSAPPWPDSSDPTPYEIFGLPKGAPYKKDRFYELAKLYHPDRRHHTSHDGIPHVTKLERYRLVVAANDILSDSAKRRQYDLYGAGWGGQPDMQNAYRTADRAWRQQPGNASMNGTWEDWERWHDEQAGKKQEPLYMSNGGFFGVVVLFALVGGFSQLSRSETHSTALVEMRDQNHGLISGDMQKRQAENMGLSRRDRVESFLKQREGWEYNRPSSHGHLWRSPDGK